MDKSKKELYTEFYDFYHNQAAPMLPEYETKRKHDLPIYTAAFSLLLFFMLTFLSAVIPVLGEKLVPYFIVGLLLSVVAFMFLSKGEKNITIDADYENNLKTKLMPEFLKIFGQFRWTKFDYKMNYWNYLKGLHKDNVFPLNYIFTIDDTICGSYKNVPINLYEIKTSMNFEMIFVLFFVFLFAASFLSIFLIISIFLLIILLSFLKWFSLLLIIPVVCFIGYYIIKILSVYGNFQGVVVELKMNKNFSGKTFLYEKKNTNRAVKNTNKKEYSKVMLEDVDFNSKFETYSTDQIEARYLLTSAFMERLKNIELAFKAKFVRAAFRDDKIFLVIGTDKDLFSMGNIHKQSNSNTFHELFEEMYSVLELVEELKLNQNIGL